MKALRAGIAEPVTTWAGRRPIDGIAVERRAVRCTMCWPTTRTSCCGYPQGPQRPSGRPQPVAGRDAPPSIGALLAGRRRVELTSEEAAEAVAWARGLDGWAASEPKPIFIYEPGTA